MRHIANILLDLFQALRWAMSTHGRTVLNANLQAVLVFYMLVAPLAISQIFIAADNKATTTQTLVQMKYAIIAGYPLLGVTLGVLLRWYELKKRHDSVWWSFWGDIAKVGIISGGLASAKLAGIITVVREIAADSNATASGGVLFMAMVPIVIIVLVTYITAREAIIRRSDVRSSNAW